MPQVPITSNVVLSVTLEHATASPPAFRVMYNQTTPAPLVYVATQPFTLNGAVASVSKDISFSEGSGITTSPVISPARLADLGVIYHHAYQAWLLTSQLGQPLDNQLPLDILAYSTESGVFWRGPVSSGANSGRDPIINIEAPASDVGDSGRPDNREWHEFGHAVMADMFANLLPWSPTPCHSPRQPGDECNHGGYANASTTDSWDEGFAEFFSLMVGRDVQRKTRPELYRASGSGINLEANYLSWTGQLIQSPTTPKVRGYEEFAVAGLLWDLVDPADADDATTLTPGGPTYADCVQTDLPHLWRIISQSWGGTVPGSPLAPPTYTYIFDVKHLYDVLTHEGIGAATSRGRALNDLDELFIAHGFFKDANGNRLYDAGEPIGWSGNVGVAGISDRPDRRSRPPITGSYIAYQARASQTGATLPLQTVNVDVHFPPPFDYLDYAYQQEVAQTPGRIYFVAPDAQYGAVAYVRAWAPGWVSTAPLTVTSSLYWEQMALDPQDYFVQHVFEMTRTTQVHLPLIVAGYGATASSVDVRGAGLMAASTHMPRACAPEPVGGTPTYTRTATPTLTRTPTGAAQATRTFTPTPTASPTRTATPTVTRTAMLTATRTPTSAPTRTATTVIGINGRVTANGAAASGRALELRYWNGSTWSTRANSTTGPDGRYVFSGVPGLAPSQWYYVRYLNTPSAPNPGPGYLWYWFGNRLSSYAAGAAAAGGDFDIADVVMVSPAEGASVTLPATFCWTRRGSTSDNYRLMFRYQSTGEEASTNYLGYVSCVSITAFPPSWQSGATYSWWVRVYQGANPDATPDNYGDASGSRNVRISF